MLRRCNGHWYVGFSTKFHVASPLAAELLTIWTGLKLAQNYNVSQLELESDALSLKSMIDNFRHYYLNHELSAALRDAITLLGHNWIVHFKHIRKDGNRVAHRLAQFGLQMKED